MLSQRNPTFTEKRERNLSGACCDRSVALTVLSVANWSNYQASVREQMNGVEQETQRDRERCSRGQESGEAKKP